VALLPRLLDKVGPPSGSHRLGGALRNSATTLAGGVRDTARLVRPLQPLAWAGSIGYFGFDVLALAAAFSAFGGTPELVRRAAGK
jgi:hypothetical protein